MNDSPRSSDELERFLRLAPSAVGSGIRSGVRGVVLLLASGIAYDALIGSIEQQFYAIPYVALTLWLVTGLLIFRACDRGGI